MARVSHLPGLVGACCLGGVCDVALLSWKCCDTREPVMTTPENVEGQALTVLI